jgi:hypothetical protein
MVGAPGNILVRQGGRLPRVGWAPGRSRKAGRMYAIIERASGRCPQHVVPLLEIVENTTSTTPLPRQRLECLPVTTDFEVSTCVRIWVSTEARAILGPDSTGASHNLSVPKTLEGRHGKRADIYT